MGAAVVRGPEGEAQGEMELPEAVFGQEVHQGALHQALLRQLAGAHQGTHDTKTRGEVSGGGRKPYRQKGTGRARQGSIRAPHFRGGGTVFGPTPRSYAMRMPRKQRRLALRAALSAKAAEGVVQIAEGLAFAAPKTRQMATYLDQIGAGRRVLLVVEGRDPNLELSARNIPQLKVVHASNLGVRDVLIADTLIFRRPALDLVVEHLG
ncbi:MAG: 50S ribosomal protein L4 [Candidatus Dormiibacterota bacterium]